jgi:hypothetical protein
MCPPSLRRTYACCIYKVFSMTGHFFLVISKSSKADAYSGCTTCVAVRTYVERLETPEACVHCKSKHYVRTPISFMCSVSSASRDCAVYSDGLRTGRPGFDSRRVRRLFLWPSQCSEQLWAPTSLLSNGSHFPGVVKLITPICCWGREWIFTSTPQQVLMEWCLISCTQGYFLLAQSPIPWVPGALSTGLKPIGWIRRNF